jgi:hypothetical protein
LLAAGDWPHRRPELVAALQELKAIQALEKKLTKVAEKAQRKQAKEAEIKDTCPWCLNPQTEHNGLNSAGKQHVLCKCVSTAEGFCSGGALCRFSHLCSAVTCKTCPVCTGDMRMKKDDLTEVKKQEMCTGCGFL